VAESLQTVSSGFLSSFEFSQPKDVHRLYVFSYDVVPNVVAAAPRAAAAAAPCRCADVDSYLLAAMLRTSPKISDLFFSPGSRRSWN